MTHQMLHNCKSVPETGAFWAAIKSALRLGFDETLNHVNVK